MSWRPLPSEIVKWAYHNLTGSIFPYGSGKSQPQKEVDVASEIVWNLSFFPVQFCKIFRNKKTFGNYRVTIAWTTTRRPPKNKRLEVELLMTCRKSSSLWCFVKVWLVVRRDCTAAEGRLMTDYRKVPHWDRSILWKRQACTIDTARGEVICFHGILGPGRLGIALSIMKYEVLEWNPQKVFLSW